MTKTEAQEIVDGINSETVIDYNWLSYLIDEDLDYKRLRALALVSGLNYTDFLEKHEGDYISEFQTKQEIYVGRVIYYFNKYHLISAQDKNYVYYFNQAGKQNYFSKSDVTQYLT